MSKKMTPENFCYWLQGKLEIDGEITALSKEQVEIINNHLQLVFTKVTPKKSSPLSLDNEETLSALKKALEKSSRCSDKDDVYC